MILQQARIYAAKINRDIAKNALNNNFGFASHVTHNDKLEYIDSQLNLANEIKQGLHDNNFTIAQRMNYYLTGNCIALLS